MGENFLENEIYQIIIEHISMEAIKRTEHTAKECDPFEETKKEVERDINKAAISTGYALGKTISATAEWGKDIGDKSLEHEY